MNTVVSLHTYRMEKQYQEFGSAALNLRLDTTYPEKVNKKDYAKELRLGYLKLLSNYSG